tara:strand:+ start:644 stop:907 length:264 start_codon:yes stop_codon:yes gene_type:complete
MVEQEQTFHLYLVLVLEIVDLLQVVVEVVDIALEKQELEAQVVVEMVVEHQETLQVQQVMLTLVVAVVDLVETQRVVQVEQVVQEQL